MTKKKIMITSFVHGIAYAIMSVPIAIMYKIDILYAIIFALFIIIITTIVFYWFYIDVIGFFAANKEKDFLNEKDST